MDFEKIAMRFWDSTLVIMVLGILASIIYRPFGHWLEMVFDTDWGMVIFFICLFGLFRLLALIITGE